MSNKKKVALVLSSGGARGYAHIGAIEELESQGYQITSVAGTSMGALIGGMYAAGKLHEVSEWMSSLGKKEILSLIDFSLSLNHIVKGDKVMDALKHIVPDVAIEDLPIPFCAVAADIKNNREVVFCKGSLYEAIRASISIPSLFKPIVSGDHVYIDGGIVNPLPLNRVKRTDGDVLVAVNVSAPDNEQRNNDRSISIHKRDALSVIQRFLPSLSSVESNYYSLISKSFSLMIEQNTVMAVQLTPPDILVSIPKNHFGGFDYDKAEKITMYGRKCMKEALERYSQS